MTRSLLTHTVHTNIYIHIYLYMYVCMLTDILTLTRIASVYKLSSSIWTQLTSYTNSVQHRQASQLGRWSTLCASRLATRHDRKCAEAIKCEPVSISIAKQQCNHTPTDLGAFEHTLSTAQVLSGIGHWIHDHTTKVSVSQCQCQCQ